MRLGLAELFDKSEIRPFSPRHSQKPRFQRFPLLSQLFLLIRRRSLSLQNNCQIRASTICQPSGGWLNYLTKVKSVRSARAIRKNRAFSASRCCRSSFCS